MRGWLAWIRAWWRRRRPPPSAPLARAPDPGALRGWLHAEYIGLRNKLGFCSGIELPRHVAFRFAHRRRWGAVAWCMPVSTLDGCVISINLRHWKGRLRLDTVPDAWQARQLRSVLIHEGLHALPGMPQDAANAHGERFTEACGVAAAVFGLPPPGQGCTSTSWPFSPPPSSWWTRINNLIRAVLRIGFRPVPGNRGQFYRG